ncbi:MAG: deoxyribonuclease [Acidobacteria bacterium]|mgnify:FL=1|nr:MAG: deoxyribonuclease [Acidobacteriota bacterium]REJ99648.1 MAG: deoxyribonuclease [Acidobacteriota bacterium]
MLSALSDGDGVPVDWFFVYKIPYRATAAGAADGGAVATGFEYLYFDSRESKPLALAPQLLTDATGAIHRTLASLLGAAGDQGSGYGWILYNDELPDSTSNRGTAGHTKGVLGYDVGSDSAFWLLHSTPRWPHPEKVFFPEDEKQYGQTFLCVTLPSVAEAEQIAAQMRREQEPQTYDCRTPPALASDSELALLAAGTAPSAAGATTSVVPFSSRGGRQFRAIAKSREWGEDFWIDLVGPELDTSLNVESWRRGTVPSELEKALPGETLPAGEHTDDVQGIDMTPLAAPYAWPYTKDHAKWAIGEGSDWVCVADLNRMVSQEKRGGGAICFEHAKLNAWLRSVEKLKPGAT